MSDSLVCVSDYERQAQTLLPKSVFDYYFSGADEQQTLRDNVAAFARYVTVHHHMNRLIPFCTLDFFPPRMANFETPDLAFSSKEGYGEDSGLAVYVTQAIDATVKWDDIAWLKRMTSLPVVVKGVLTAEDAKEALKYGLDGVPATIDVLPAVVEAVEGKVDVFMDGGVHKGTDVLKALALGAKAVFVGRPVLWALACEGDKGVSNVLQILRKELHLALALTGICIGAYRYRIVPNIRRYFFLGNTSEKTRTLTKIKMDNIKYGSSFPQQD
uniref:Hydroxyacid oxidase (glycolate oxidase) 1 n=1 Tax=Sinocyclocheilus rhinocerous TaxID=307959 RepID=A0A673GGQ3_9TELE